MDLIQSKKMIFSAVALVAFSFAGMANEVENSLENQNCWECNLGKFLDKYSPCFSAADAVTTTLRQFDLDEMIIEEAAGAAFRSCANDIDG